MTDRARNAGEFGELGRWLIMRNRIGPGWLLFHPDSCDHSGPVECHATFDAARLSFIDQNVGEAWA